MTWVKFSDDTPRTAEDLSDAEFRLWFDLHCHSMQQLSDGFLAARDRVWVLNGRPEALFDALITAGRIEPAAVGWRIVGFEDSQSTASEIETGRARANERQKRQRKHKIGDHSDCQARYCSAVRDGWTPSRVTSSRDTTFPEAKRPEATLGAEGAKRSATASAGATASAALTAERQLDLPDGWTIRVTPVEFAPNHSSIQIEGKYDIRLRIAARPDSWGGQIVNEEGDGCSLCSATFTKGAGRNRSTLTLVIPTDVVNSELLNEIVEIISGGTE